MFSNIKNLTCLDSTQKAAFLCSYFHKETYTRVSVGFCGLPDITQSSPWVVLASSRVMATHQMPRFSLHWPDWQVPKTITVEVSMDQKSAGGGR